VTKRFATSVLLALTAAAMPLPSLADGHTMQSVQVTSFDGTLIDINVCRPAGASADNPVPMVLQGHGWGGNKSSCIDRVSYFNSGIGFVSMSQRGAGESGGESNVMDPDFEGRDIMAVLDYMASLDWVLKDDGPGGVDPVVGGLGGSYGGGFQWVGAFSDQYFRGQPTRFNSLRPGNTWYDLRESLAPNGVMRSVIVSGLYANGARSYPLAPWMHAAMATFVASGMVFDGPGPTAFASELHQHGSAWFVEQGQKLDIPVYMQQGAADLVFNLNDGLHNFWEALTPGARARSVFFNDQGGHNIPAQVPTGPLPYTARSETQCAAPGELAWFKHTLLGQPLGQDTGVMNLRTVNGTCVTLSTLPEAAAVSVAEPIVIATGPRGIVQGAELGSGPLTLAGIPTISFDATATDPDARVFWGLARGTSLEDAELIGAQWMPTRVSAPAIASPVVSDLGGVVAEVPAGQKLFLVASPAVDQFLVHSNRTPGALLAENIQVGLPLVGN
jgi:ABC-2 type transport system ATP-binding protein